MPRLALAVLLASVVSLAAPLAAAAQQFPFCAPGEQPRFEHGLELLRANLGAVMGEPITCPHSNPDNGDTLQQTTTGLAYVRVRDRTPTFTDGWKHWAVVNGGLVYWTGRDPAPPDEVAGVRTEEVAGVGAERPVFAYYYAWWDAGVFDTTIQRPYEWRDSDSSEALRTAMDEARSAGIDAFIVSWTGTGDRPDRAVQFLLDNGFPATVHFETPRFAAFGVEDVVAQLRALYATRLGHPGFARLQGRPVIFFWRASTYDDATWDHIRAAVDPERRALWIADGDTFSILHGAAWDGISPYAIAWSPTPQAHLASWGQRARMAAPEKLWLPPVSPGCDDSRARPTTCLRLRSPDYYQMTWDGALTSGPDGVVVSTFNEWLENTHVRPSVEEGDVYLQITRQNVEALRAF